MISFLLLGFLCIAVLGHPIEEELAKDEALEMDQDREIATVKYRDYGDGFPDGSCFMRFVVHCPALKAAGISYCYGGTCYKPNGATKHDPKYRSCKGCW